VRRPALALILLTLGVVAAPAHAASTPSYQNPVFDVRAFPDPMVLSVGSGSRPSYYAYATGTGFPIIRSTDLVHWTSLGLALPTRPSWVVQTGDSHPWAPSVLERPQPCPGATNGPCFVMYHVGTSRQFRTDCIGLATSPDPEGPWTERGILDETSGARDASGRPIGCGDDAGYQNIDPAPFVDTDGTLYLYVSTGRICPAPAANAVCPGKPTISVLPMAPDGLHAAGARTALFSADPGSWEQSGSLPIVENPWMVKHGAGYHLLYSGGDYTERYGMGEAVGSSPLGPFTKVVTNPLLTDTSDVVSAGGGSTVIGPDGAEWLAYFGRKGSRAGIRTLRVEPLTVNADGTFARLVPTVTFQDHDPPETSITAGPRGPTRFASARVRFAASETGTFACSLDGAPAGPCSSPYVTPRLSDGRHALTVTATDAAGNVDPTPAARSWTTDTRAPATSIARGPRGFVRSSRATFSFRATEPGASFHCSLDRGRARTCRGRTAFTRLAPGPHTLLVRARDRAGSTDRRGRRRGWVVLGATRRVGLRIAPRQRGRITFAVRCAASCRARIVATVAGRTAGALTVRRPGRAVLAVRAPGRGPVTVLLTARRTDGPGIATALTTLIRSRRP